MSKVFNKMSEEPDYLSNGMKSILFGLVGIVSCIMAAYFTPPGIGSYLLFYGVPVLCGFIAIIYGTTGLINNEKRGLALVGLLIGIISLLSFRIYWHGWDFC